MAVDGEGDLHIIMQQTKRRLPICVYLPGMEVYDEVPEAPGPCEVYAGHP